MLSIDDFEQEEKEIRKKYESMLLAELLYLNYRYKNNKDCYTSSGDFIYKTLNDQLAYTDEEKLNIKQEAIRKLNKKHNLLIKDFNNLKYEEEKI